LPAKKVFKTNILEDDLEELAISNGEVELDYKPFELITLRLQL
jgi:alpha-mannosidase